MSLNGQPTYYEFFGLENFETDQKKIKAAYRSMALKYHPDRNEDKNYADHMMKQVNEVYRVLSSEKDRYDRHLKIKMGIEQPQRTQVVFFFKDGGTSTVSGWYTS